MQIPAIILAKIYSLLCEYDEKPIMNEVMFIDGFTKEWLYIYGVGCKTMDFHCKPPLLCEMSLLASSEKTQENMDKLAKLNEELSRLTNRYNKIMMFW